ncbi:MAG: hypothetical protein JWQ72_3197 [Polaromonas sp.]|nr:hypothetical protein [Polaromonas sp.]
MNEVNELIRWVGDMLCALDTISCVCRMDMMKVHDNGVGWMAVYGFFGAFAVGVGTDLAVNHWVDWYEATGVAGLLLYLVLTRRHWSDGPPPETRRTAL